MNATVRQLATKALLPAGAAIAISWSIFYANLLGATVTATWTYDYEPEPACSSTQTTNCIDHFEVKDITNQQDITLIKKVNNPEHPVGKVDHISAVFKYGPPFGLRTISVIAVARGPKGNRVCSNPFAARATVAIRPGTQMSVLF